MQFLRAQHGRVVGVCLGIVFLGARLRHGLNRIGYGHDLRPLVRGIAAQVGVRDGATPDYGYTYHGFVFLHSVALARFLRAWSKLRVLYITR